MTSDKSTNNDLDKLHKDAVDQFFDTDFNQWHTIYDENKRADFFSFDIIKRKQAIFNVLETYVGKYKNVLECGCGSGDIMKDIVSLGYNVVGVDLNKRLLTIAGENFKTILHPENDKNINKVHLVQSDVEYLPFPDDTFDVVYCAGLLSYLPDDYKTISEIHRTVKSGGIVIITLPNIFPIFKFFDPYYYVVSGFDYILRKIRLRKKRTGNSQIKFQFKASIARRYYYGQLSKIFRKFNLHEFASVNVSYGPFTFWRKKVFSLPFSTKMSEYLVKKAQKKPFLLLKFIANRWVICMQKNDFPSV